MGPLISTSDPSQAAFWGGLVGSMLVSIFIGLAIYYILFIIAYWKILVKAGEKGWKALIPIYNVYLMYKIVNMKSWFWYLIGISICAEIMMAVDGYPYGVTAEQMSTLSITAHPMTVIALVGVSIITLIATIIYVYRTSKVFGHGIGFAIGLFFLPFIFWLILAFGNSKYDKKRLKK